MFKASRFRFSKSSMFRLGGVSRLRLANCGEARDGMQHGWAASLASLLLAYGRCDDSEYLAMAITSSFASIKTL